MKATIFLLAGIFFASFCSAQPTSAARGVTYGQVSEKGTIVQVDKLEANLKADKYEGRILGKVKEVCQAEGCWIRLEKSDGTSLLVRSKNHSFVMPKNIVGKTVVAEGEANVSQVSEAMRKHLAEDAGKSREEIEKIKGESKEIVFMAKGVKVL